MLDKWEKEGVSFLLGDQKQQLIDQGNSGRYFIDIEAPLPPVRRNSHGDNQYSKLFDF